MPIDSRQYDSAVDFIQSEAEFSKTVGNVSNLDDRLRLMSYELYEDFYHNRPEHMRVVLRGEDDDEVEIYVPSYKKCVEAINRFLCVNFTYQIDPDQGNSTDQDAVESWLDNLFDKEHVLTKFNTMKRYMLIKGDGCFHIQGVPFERPGRRVKVLELKPETYYPIEDPVTGAPLGCHIVEIIRNPKNTPNTEKFTGDFVVRRQTYRRIVDKNNIPVIDPNLPKVTSEISLWEIGRWDDRVTWSQLSLIDIIQPAFPLPKEISEIPIYHWKNNPPPGSTWGMAEGAGVETIMSAMNQAMSDEDLTLITQGLGVYWTDAAPPVDENGNETEWEIGPGSVVQVGAGSNFGRVNGVSSVSPYGDHIDRLDEFMQQSLGVPDITIGQVDVATAESGIALQLKLSPLLAKNAEKELTISDKTDDFLSDLINGFMPAYEGIQPNGVSVSSQFDDPMPKNQSNQLMDVLSIWTQANAQGQILPVEWLYEQLNEIMGYDLDVNSDLDKAIEEGTRIAGEAMAGTGMGGGPNGSQFGDQMDAQLGDQPEQLNGNQYTFSNIGN
jgi:hypothetical protein